jgi:hypothetical protein
MGLQIAVHVIWSDHDSKISCLRIARGGVCQPKRSREQKGDHENLPKEGPSDCEARRGYGPLLLEYAWSLPPETLKTKPSNHHLPVAHGLRGYRPCLPCKPASFS